MPKPVPKAQPWIVNSLNLVASFFKVSQRAVGMWRDTGMPYVQLDEDNALYDLSEINIWKQARDDGGSSTARQTKSELEAEKLRVDIATKKMAYMKEAGELVERTTAIRAAKEVINRIRGRLESLPEELGVELPPEYRSEYVANATHKIRMLSLEIASWNWDGKQTRKGEPA